MKNYQLRFRKLALLLLIIPIKIFGRIRYFFIPKTGERIIIIFYPGKMGDLVCLTPILRSVKEKYLKNKVILYGRSQFVDLLKNNPDVDVVIGFKSDEQAKIRWLLKEWRQWRDFEMIAFFNLINNFEGGVLGLFFAPRLRFMVKTALDGWTQKILRFFYKTREYEFDCLIKDFYFESLANFGIAVLDKKNQLFFPGVLPEAESFFTNNNLSEKTTVGISVSSGKDYKIWPQKYWIELINLLCKKYKFDFIFFGVSEEIDIIENIRHGILARHFVILDKKLDILPYYLKKCQLFISVDTGLLYIADALAVPVVDIMGSSDDTNQRPENKYRIVNNREFCYPYGKMLYNGPMDFAAIKLCFKSIRPEQVFAACQNLLKDETTYTGGV